MRTSRYSDKDVRKMRALHESGLTQKQIAEKFGCSQKNVSYLFESRRREDCGLKEERPRKATKDRPLGIMENPDKQLVRNALVSFVFGAFSVEEVNSLRVLTLPGDALNSPHSAENQLLNAYNRVDLVCLERDGEQYEEILEHIESVGHKSVTAHNLTIEKYLQTTRSSYDVVWLDTCGAATDERMGAWMKLFQHYQMNQPSVFALTTNESPRCRSELDSSRLSRAIQREIEAAGYEVGRYVSLGYKSNRHPMRADIFQIKPE